jgi:hypothetical protein
MVTSCAPYLKVLLALTVRVPRKNGLSGEGLRNAGG